MSNHHDTRYSASSSMMLQRPERRRTPSPGPPPPLPYPAYDRYVPLPPRGGSFFREPFPNSYRPDSWHVDRPYPGSPPSPDRYRPPRPLEGEGWARPSWRPPDEAPWPDRRPVIEVYDPPWPRPRRDTMAQPMFEPSDNWKHSHGGGPELPEGDGREWSYDRHPGSPIRDRSPERLPLRDAFPPAYASGERFRRLSGTPDPRDPHPYGPRSDSYRPTYEDRGAWGASSYHPGGMEIRSRDPRPLREPRFVPRQETTGDRSWYGRDRSASGGSVQNSPLPSPIRSRTNLPDRVPFGHSRSNSGSYPQSPVNKSISRPTWDVEPAPQSRCPSPKLKSRSVSQEMTNAASRKPEPTNDEPGAQWVTRQPPRSPSPMSSEKPALPPSRSLSRSPEHHNGISSVIPPQPPHYVETESVQPEVASVVHLHTSTAAPGEVRVGADSVAFFPSSSRQTHQLHTDERPLSSQPTSTGARQLVPLESQRSLPASPRIPTNDVSHIPSSQHTAAVQPTSRDSSPEPDIPLAALAKHMSTRTFPSGPSTPLPEQSEPPSRDELSLPPQTWLAPNIQSTSEPMPLHEVLRAVVMVRLQRDRQTQEERVTPVLLDNLSKSGPPFMPSVATPEDVIREVITGSRKKTREASHADAKESLQVRFAQRKADLTNKVARLREEYMGLHRQWLVHCGKLDEVAKEIALQEAAATAGRTTRRSLATMGDAVRSDLEMEQIIASLGNEEMTDANHLGAKNAAVIPDMITVTRGEIDYLYDDTNNEVEKPLEYYAPQTGIDDWTEEEVNIFLDKFGEFPKQFGIIADFLPNKTPSQCVTFYYLHKNKHIDFRQVVARRATKRKRGGRKQKSNALLADIRKRDDEVSAAGSGRRKRAAASAVSSTEPRKGSGRRAAAVAQAEQTPNGTPTPEPDTEPRKRRRRVVTARSAAAAEMDDGAEEMDVDAKPKRTRKPRRAAVSTTSASTPLSITPLATPALTDAFRTNPMEYPMSLTRFANQAGPSMQRKPSNSAWTEEDKDLFLHLLAQYGDDFKRIAASMPNKTTVQVGAFYRAHADEMNLHEIVARAPKRSPTPEHRQGVWKHATFTGPSVSFQKTRPPAEHYQLSANRLNIDPHFIKGYLFSSSQASSGSGRSTPTGSIPAPAVGAFPYHPSPYETVRMPYGYHRPPAMVAENLSQASMSTMHTHPIEHIANPSPFATGPLTTRFSSFPYRNFSPSHFTDSSAPSFSAASVQSSYAQNAGAHESAPYIAKMSNMSSSNYR